MSDSEEDNEPKYEVVFEDEPEKKYNFLPMKDGKASATFPNGDKYLGEYKDGMKHGKGHYVFKNGSYYRGDYIKNKKQGFGEYVAPDKGKYTGAWHNDKRHGEGTYIYPNGDSHSGEWKNGAKHGPGSYTYANIDSSVNGSFSNGRVVDGQWRLHDDSQYVGAFLNNQPAGEGLYVFPNGNSAYGRFANAQFHVGTFTPPHPNASQPEVKRPDMFKRACRLVDKSVARADHFNSMHHLKAKWTGVPNFRQVKNVVGCGQPSLEGFRSAIEHCTENEMDKIHWVNLRDDPVVYVSGYPFSSRDPKNILKELKFPALTVANVAELETRLADNFKFQVTKKGGLHDFIEDLHNADTQNTTPTQKTLPVPELTNVKSLAQLYEALAEDDLVVDAKRVPIADLPSFEDFDKVAQLVRSMESGGVVFNDALGGVRTTSAMVIALLTLGGGSAGAEEAEEEEEDEEEEEGNKKKKKNEVEPYDEAAPIYPRGEYAMVMEMVRLLNGPDPEEARRVKKAEEAKLKAEADARKAEEDAVRKAKEEEEKAAAAANEGDETAGANEGDEAKPEGEEGEKPEGEGEGDEGDEGEEKEANQDAANEGDETQEPEDDTPLDWIKFGTVAKAAADEVIDKCSAMSNIRQAIWDAQESKDISEAKSQLQRYCNFILFAAYLKDVRDNSLKEENPDKAPAKGGGDDDDEEESGDDEAVLSFANWCKRDGTPAVTFLETAEAAYADFKWS